jgi:hypothetical protein
MSLTIIIDSKIILILGCIVIPSYLTIDVLLFSFRTYQMSTNDIKQRKIINKRYI